MKKAKARLLWSAGFVLAVMSLALWPAAEGTRSEDTQRGKYFVDGSGCGDCHTPWKMGPSGPEPDQARLLSGHPEGLPMPAAPRLGQGLWQIVASITFTAWHGPWGTSFTANLTPDRETGLGLWTAENFVAAIRTGRRMGRGRQILPPMPYPALRNLTDDDLRAIFAYLKSIPVLVNKVPDPIPPDDAGPR
jgi:mono/diheme cytochrome c family protein